MRVAPGEGDLESFIAGIDEGLLVASLQGLHSGVNAVSGDLSVGVEGVMIRSGELAEPIREGTLAGAIPRMLLDVVGFCVIFWLCRCRASGRSPATIGLLLLW